MMAMLWVQQIRQGKKTQEQVPRLLKEKVDQILKRFSDDLTIA